MKAFAYFAKSDIRSIEHGLNARKTFKKLAQKFKKHLSSIASEVKKHRELLEPGGSGHCFNECLHKAGCKRRGLCGHNTHCFKKYSHTCLKRPSIMTIFAGREASC